MVKYQYDAWGRWLNQATAAKTSIGTTLLSLNPFLYKGYIYDDETGFYYLKSRYYSPEVRRFINVDSEVGDVGNLENYNLFAYCINNPVMLADENGNMPKWLKVTLISLALAVTIVAVAVAVIATAGAAAALIGGLTVATAVTTGGTTAIVISMSATALASASTLLSIAMTSTIIAVVSGTIGMTLYNLENSNMIGGNSILGNIGSDDNSLSFSSMSNTLEGYTHFARSKDEVDPYRRPNQKGQGRELKSKARLKFKDVSKFRNGRKKPKKHTPGRDHRHHLLLLFADYLMRYLNGDN